jgi:hypothetical protein
LEQEFCPTLKKEKGLLECKVEDQREELSVVRVKVEDHRDHMSWMLEHSAQP